MVRQRRCTRDSAGDIAKDLAVFDLRANHLTAGTNRCWLDSTGVAYRRVGLRSISSGTTNSIPSPGWTWSARKLVTAYTTSAKRTAGYFPRALPKTDPWVGMGPYSNTDLQTWTSTQGTALNPVLAGVRLHSHSLRHPRSVLLLPYR